jgi:mannosyltransferase
LNQLSHIKDLRGGPHDSPPQRFPRILSTGRWTVPAGIGLLAFCVAFIGSWIPSFWDDEIATISAAGRSSGELLVLLQSVDAVHGLYYYFMHVWTSVLGISEVAMRTPSSLAAGLACAGTVVIGRRLGSDFIGIASGLVLAVLPRMVWAGTEARQSAFTAMLAVGLTLLLVRAWKSNRTLDWVLYGICAVVGIFVFMFFALAVVSHAVAAVILRKRPIALLITSTAAGAVVLPFLLFALTQKAQVEWIQNRSLAQNLAIAAVKQFFYGDDRPTGNLPPQWLLAFVVLLGVLQIGLVALGLWSARLSPALRPLVVLSLTGVALPMAGLLLVSVIAQPVYVARYLTFTAPAFALLVGLGLDRLRTGRRWLLPLAAVLVAGSSLVPQLTLKSLVNEPQDTERRIAAVIDGETQGQAAVVFQNPELRDMALAYPEAFTSITDISLAETPADSGTLWGTNAKLSAEQLSGRGEVWFVGPGGGAPSDLAAFDTAGCVQTRKMTFQRVLLISYNCP